MENCYNVYIAVSTANIDAKELGIMRFTIRGKNIEVTEGLRSAVTEKLGKLEKYFTPETEIIVTLSVEKDRQKIEVTIPVKGNIIRSEQVSNDMYVSIDLVEEVIERQLRKYKTKIIGKHKDGGNLRKEFIEKENEGEEEEEAESALTIDETAKVPVKAVVDGKVIAIEDVKDGIFSEKVLGDGVGIIPTSETVLAPAEGEICTVMEGSKHAIGVRTTNNSVFLIHVGIETVSMNGEGFEYLVKKGQHVKEGQPILKFDKAKIEAKGLNPVVVFVKTDEGNQTPVAFKTGINVKAGKDVIGE